MSGLGRKKAQPLDTLVKYWIVSNGLTPRLNSRRIFEAWDHVSGAGKYTVRRYFREGRLYITVNSSVVRSQLMMQRDVYLSKINALLCEDELFNPDDPSTGYVKELILK